MRKIFKQQILSLYEELKLPKNLNVIHFGTQNLVTCMWYEFDTEAPLVTTTIRVFGTGHVIKDDRLKHIGTIMDGAYVWHYYMMQSNGFSD